MNDLEKNIRPAHCFITCVCEKFSHADGKTKIEEI
jgi:hypothetical protein